MAADDYETGIASSPSDVVDKLAAFAVANGWTVNSPLSGKVFVKDDVYVGVSSDSDEVFARGALGYDAGLAWNAQPNHSGLTVALNLTVGPYTSYHFFAGDEEGCPYLNAIIEFTAGRFRHLAFGKLIKRGNYTGGTYVDGVRWNNNNAYQNIPDRVEHTVICDANSSSGSGHFACDYDGKTNNWQRCITTAGTAYALGSARSNSMTQMYNAVGVQNWNMRNLMWPLSYFANRASNLRSPVGRIPNMRMVNMKNLLPGETLTVGGDGWMVFPLVQRTESWGSGNSAIESSGYYGYAYKMP
jgi:hypothetical protein